MGFKYEKEFFENYVNKWIKAYELQIIDLSIQFIIDEEVNTRYIVIPINTYLGITIYLILDIKEATLVKYSYTINNEIVVVEKFN